jgi:hypothetical protein
VEPSPSGAPTSVATRLTEQQISANRYRLNYMAPPSMSAEEIKDRTMMGAAKLTIDKGNSWFEVADQASGDHKHTLEIIMGKGETLAGGAARQYDAKELYAQLSGKLS